MIQHVIQHVNIVLDQINAHVKLDGVVQFVIIAQMDITQVVKIVCNVVTVVIMEFVQMDRVEMVYVHAIQVIQPLIIQLIIALFVLMVM